MVQSYQVKLSLFSKFYVVIDADSIEEAIGIASDMSVAEAEFIQSDTEITGVWLLEGK